MILRIYWGFKSYGTSLYALVPSRLGNNLDNIPRETPSAKARSSGYVAAFIETERSLSRCKTISVNQETIGQWERTKKRGRGVTFEKAPSAWDA